MYTIQSLRLLHRLKKAQGDEQCKVYINTEDLTARRVTETSEARECVSLSGFETSLGSTLNFLQRKGALSYVKYSVHPDIYCHVSHDGYHLFQWSTQTALSFLFKSVLVPIVVAAITAFIVSKVT